MCLFFFSFFALVANEAQPQAHHHHLSILIGSGGHGHVCLLLEQSVPFGAVQQISSLFEISGTGVQVIIIPDGLIAIGFRVLSFKWNRRRILTSATY